MASQESTYGVAPRLASIVTAIRLCRAIAYRPRCHSVAAGEEGGRWPRLQLGHENRTADATTMRRAPGVSSAAGDSIPLGHNAESHSIPALTTAGRGSRSRCSRERPPSPSAIYAEKTTSVPERATTNSNEDGPDGFRLPGARMRRAICLIADPPGLGSDPACCVAEHS